MKKIFITAAGIFMLCLTSCASKKAPIEENLTEAPQTDIIENSKSESDMVTMPEAAAQTAEADTQNINYENTAVSPETLQEEENIISSKDFPEPELLEEPEIITLEPEDEIIISEEEPAAEQVINEEPPLIPENENKALDDISQNLDSSEEEKAVNSTDDETNTELEAITNATNITDDSDITISDDDVVIVDRENIEDTAENNSQTNVEAESISPSRSVTLKKFEYLDITYPGTGWVYMGLTDNSKDLTYFGRKLGTKDTKFSLQARNAGNKIVHFYKNDPLSGRYLDDYVEVIILSENGSNKTHIEAPEYKLPVQKKEVEAVKEAEAKNVEEEAEEEKITNTTSNAVEKENTSSSTTDNKTSTSEDTSEESTKTAAEEVSDSTKTETSAETNTTTVATSSEEENTEAYESSSVQAYSSPETLLQEAQVLYNEKEYSAALAKLNQFFEYSTDNRDTALYLKGQILEAKSEVRDIKGAMEAYTSLTKNYPASKLWDSANKRIIYLKRFYLEVR